MQPERKHKDYQPFPAFMIFAYLTSIPNSLKRPGGYRNASTGLASAGNITDSLTPGRWTMFQDMSARLQMLILPLKKRP